MVFLVIFFGAMHGLFLLPVLLSLFGPGSCQSLKSEDDDEETKHSAVEKTFPHPFCIPHPSLHPMNHHNNGFMFRNPNGEFNSPSPHVMANGKTGYDSNLKSKSNGPPNFGVPLPGLPSHVYNGGGGVKYVDGNGSMILEKELGIGTSGEDSSESSSSQSQRRLQREAEEEEQRRRYEDGWRKSSANANLPLNTRTKPREFQPPHIMEVYNNSGYISDEEGRSRSRSWYRNSHTQPVKHHNDSYIEQRFSTHEVHNHGRPRSKSQHNPHFHCHSRNSTNYNGDVKFR